MKIIAFGDSLTAGFGLAADAAFPAVLEKTLRAEGYAVSVVNAGVSGDTASGGQARLAWSLGDGADGVILELGANDMLRGVDPEVTKAALDAILGELKARNIKVLIAGMKAASSLGEDYKRRFDAIYPALAKKYGAPLYPFFLEGVAGERLLNSAMDCIPIRRELNASSKAFFPASARLWTNSVQERRAANKRALFRCNISGRCRGLNFSNG